MQNPSRFQLLETSITTTVTNPAGCISAAKLKVSGLLKRATSAEAARNLHWWYLLEYDPVHPHSQAGPQIGRISFDISAESFPQPVYCLSVIDYGMVDAAIFDERVRSGQNFAVNGRIMPRFTPHNGGLALVPTNEAATEFRRVGVVEWDEGWFDDCQPVTISLI